ncbi:MAG: hypothetical protein DCC55_23760, partial [Chloroflexi bacterium]
MSGFRLHLFGHFYLLADGQPVSAFRSLQARALLAYLVVEHHRPVGRKQLAKLLWGGYTAAAAQANLRVSLSNLRQLFRPLELLQTNYQSVQFVVDHSAFWCDAVALAQWSQTAAEGTPAPLPVESSWRNQGEFLEEFDEIGSDPFRTWLQQKRTFFWHLRQQVAQLAAATEAADRPRPLPPLTIRTAGPTSSLAPGAPADGERTEAPAAEQAPAPPVAALPNDELALVPRVAAFYGRQAELAQLTGWVMDPHCRLVAILGMGGQGKSVLTARLVQLLATHEAAPPLQPARPFAHILWSSLLNAPPLSEVLHQWVQTLSGQQVSQLPASLDQQLELLLGYLWRQRCLLVLDNVESILVTGERAGQYRPGYEAYGQLLQRVGEFDHQSCLLLTSREEPYGWTRLALGATAIRSLRLGGLAAPAGQTMLHELGLRGDGAASAEVVRRYSGNPLALKLVAAVIQELFAGDVRTFLADETLVFDDIRDVLDQHFARLSPLEREVMTWLAIERQPVELPVLIDNLVQAPSHRVVLETLRSLHRRSLLEQDRERLGLQNVVLEYTTDHLVEKMCQELGDFGFRILDFGVEDGASEIQNPKSKIQNSHLNRFALVKAQAKEYVRESQVRMLLQPVADFLTGHWSKERVAKRLQQVLDRLRSEAPLAPGYAAANVIHLLMQMQLHLRGYDFSRLTVWQADLRQAGLPGVNFAQADLTHSLFLEPVEIIRALAFSPDGRRLVGGAYNGDIHVWRMVDHQVERLLQGHRGVIYSVAVSPDGRLLASASSDQTARLWDLATGELYSILRGHGSEVILVAFDAGGELLISMGQDGVVRTWPLPTLLNNSVCDQPLTKFGGTANPVFLAAASGDGAWVAGGGDDGVVHCWDVRRGQLRASLQGHTEGIIDLAISPDGKTLASASHDRTVCLWMLADQAAADPDCLRHCLPEYANRLAISPDGALLASGLNPYLCLWEVRERGSRWDGRDQLRQRLAGHASLIGALAFSPDGKTLVSASYDQSVLLWNVSSGQAEHKLYGQARSVELVQFSPDGTLISSYYDHAVQLWGQNGLHVHTLPGHENVVRHAACSPLGAGSRQLLATSGSHTTIRLWDLRTGEQQFTLRRHTSSVSALAFSPDGLTLVSGGVDALVCLWDVQTGEPTGIFQGHRGQIKWVVFNTEGTLLATGSGDHTIRIWNMGAPGSPTAERGQLRHILQGHTGMVRCVAFHPDGRMVASASDDQTVRLWDAVTGQLCQTLQGHTQPVICTSFSPDGRTLVSVSDDQTMRVWAVDTATGTYQLRHVLPEQVYKFDCIALSPDNRTLVSGSVDTTVRVWDLQTGQLCHALKGHTNLITSVDISPDARRIASGCSNGMVRVWDAQTGECLHTPRPEGPYAGMDITGV